MDLLKKVEWRVYPVGRLDFDAEGLLLLTNDGDLTHILSHPRFSIPRTYLVKVTGVPDEKKLDTAKEGGDARRWKGESGFFLHPPPWREEQLGSGCGHRGEKPPGEEDVCSHRPSCSQIEKG